MTTNIAIVGTGGMGTVHYKNYLRIPNVQITGLVDISGQGLASAKAWKLPVFSTIEDLVANVPVNIVDVCTPTFLHKEHSLSALALGCHVICEKPAALTRLDAEEMFQAADAVGRQLYIAQVLQFSPEIEALQKIVDSNEFGHILDARFERVTGRPTWIKNGWLFDKSKSGLLPFDLHIHDLFAIISLFGNPIDFNYTQTNRPGSDISEHYRVAYRFANFSISAEAAWFNANYPFVAQWRVVFEKAVVEFSNSKLIVYPASKPSLEISLDDEPKIETGINLPPTGMFYHELSHFVECANHNRASNRVRRENILSAIDILESFNHL